MSLGYYHHIRMTITTPVATGHPPAAYKYRPDIDGLRAIAVLLVVIFHAFPRFIKGGFIGVDVFFVISGYLISTIIFSSLADNRFSYIEFYIRRIKRILPALLLVIMSSAVLGWYVLLADEYQQLGTHIVAGTSFVSNFVLWNEAGYFDRQSFEKPLLHLWSLAIEEQFYIVWPLLLGLVFKNKWNFLIPVFILLFFSFITNIYLTNSSEISAFYAPWSRFWELMVGCLLAYIKLYKPTLWSSNKNGQSAIGLLLIFLAALVINKQSAFPGWWALMPTVGAFLIINAGPDTWLSRHFLSKPKMVWMGLISYPLYLWHWPIFSFIHIVIFKEKINPAIFVLAIVFSIFFAWITYHFIEKKIRYSQKNIIAIVLLIICIFFALVGLCIQQEKLTSRNNSMDMGFIAKALADIEYESKIASREINHLDLYYIDKKTDQTVLFIGDSHIRQYIPRIVELSENPNFNMKSVYITLRDGCPMIPDVFDDLVTKCKKAWVERLDFALNSKVDAIVIGACWNCVLTSTVDKPMITSAEDPRKARALNVLENLLKQMAAKKTVYLLLDNPNNKLFNPRNFFEGSRLKKLTLRKLAEPLQLDYEQKTLREELTAIAHRAGALVIDPMPSLCPEGKCHILTDEGKPIYTDNHHLSASWTRKFADYIDITVKASEEGATHQ